MLGYLVGMGVSYALLPLLGDGEGVVVDLDAGSPPARSALAVAIGSVASLYPALHASRLDPTVALRAL